jgi:phenylacetate-coenzyme A ligase PaaK-like adenylate-forming protein
VCQAAIEHGLDIKGTHFFVAGEPLTEAKRQQIEAAGALVTPRYFITEIGIVGSGCPSTGAVDDVHLLSDSVVIIQRQKKVEHTDISVNAFLFTNLLYAAPKILLNVETDDYGIMETRHCGCLWDELGFNQHVHTIRSYAKLTGSGMTIMGSDFVRILEQVLPGQYGGMATDYQLLEEEDTNGQTHLSLIISPKVGEIDNDAVIHTVLDELSHGIHGGRLAAGFWSQVNTLQIKRMYPMSSSGKIATLHLTKKG